MGKQEQTQPPSKSVALVKAGDADALAGALKKAEKTLITFLGSPDMAQRAWKVVYTLVRRTPDLQKCSVQSIVNGMLESAQFGLELGSEAYLVPFYNKALESHEAQFIADWKGLVRLAVRVEALTGGHGDLVYADDEYRCERSGDEVLFRHVRQRFGKRATQDNHEAHVKAGCQGVYFIGYRQAGPPTIAELPVDEVEYVRKTFSKQPDSPLWTKRWSFAAIKTAAKQAMKLVPRSPKLDHLIELDNRRESGIRAGVIDGDEAAVAPYVEPKPIAPAKEPTESEIRSEDARLAASDK